MFTIDGDCSCKEKTCTNMEEGIIYSKTGEIHLGTGYGLFEHFLMFQHELLLLNISSLT